MKICKYILPCGRCDKFDRRCDLTYEDEDSEPISSISKLPEEECDKCNHDWYKERMWLLPADDEHEEAYYTVRYVCRKCKAVDIKDVNMKDLNP